MSNKHFELFPQRLLDGRRAEVPVYFDDRKNYLPESRALLEAAKIIDAAVHEDGAGVTLQAVVDELGEIITNNDHTKGLLIADPDGYGSVRVKHDETVVDVRTGFQERIETSLFFDMMYVWNEQEQATAGPS